MIDDIKVMSATTFLEELYMLFGNDWVYRKKRKEHQANGISIPKNDQGEYDDRSLMSGMLGIFAAMGNNGRDETSEIKSYFLMNHGVKPKGKVVHVWFGNEDHSEEIRRYTDY